MATNQPVTMKIKKNDTVVITVGKHKGKTGKVLATHPKQQAVTVEGIGMVKRHIKPSQINPRGGTKDVHIPVSASKVALVHPTDSKKTTRVGYQINKAGDKVRIAKQANNKEIK